MGAPMNATSLDLRHDPVEDRLVVIARGADADPVALTLTRRLTRALLGKLADLLMRSNEEVGRAPAEHREEVFLFEHMAALSDAAASAPSGEEGDGTPAPPAAGREPADTVMVLRIDFTIRPAGFDIVLFDADKPRVTVALTRFETHRVLDLLVRKAREAEWGFDELDWLDRRRHIVVPEAAALS